MEDFEKKINEIKKENQKYLTIYEKHLEEKGLSERTIKNHVGDVDFYINDYLAYYGPYTMKEGCYEIDDFLGDFFIRKCTWSTPYTIKTTATSMKSFYKVMLDNGYIKKEEYTFLTNEIKNKIKDWQEEVEKYNSFDMDF